MPSSASRVCACAYCAPSAPGRTAQLRRAAPGFNRSQGAIEIAPERPADGNLRPVVEQQHLLAADPRLQLLHPIQIDDGRTVHADELPRIEARREPRHGFTDEV